MPGSEPEMAEGGPVDGYLDGTFSLDMDQFFANFRVVRYEEWATGEADNSKLTVRLRQATPVIVSEQHLFDRFLPAVVARIGGGLAVAFVGIALLWMPVDLLIATYSAQQWPVTSGRIMQNEAFVTSPRQIGSFTDLGLRYIYTVGERSYRSHVIGGMTDVLIGADDFVLKNNNYPVGKTVPVHFNPKAPEDSCLRTGFDPYKTLLFVFWILAAFGLFAYGVGIVFDGRLFTDMIEARRKKAEAEALHFDELN